MAIGIIGYEESQTVTMAFRIKGHSFRSCDLQECSGGFPEHHIKNDIRKVLNHYHDYPYKLDFIGLHPVCKLLANSGVRWLASKYPKHGYEWSKEYKIYLNHDRWEKMVAAAREFKWSIEQVKNAGKGYIENPIMHKYASEIIGIKPTQIIQPWQFGHTTSKATCLWIFGLPKLEPTEIIPKELRTYEIHKCKPGPEREKIRSKTFPGIAKAMAEQWGGFL